MRESMALLAWLETATSGILFGPDRKAVRAELYAHLEDKTLELMRLFPGMEPDEARDKALAGMGDAETVKKELAKIHRPWLGWLWMASRWLMWGALVWFWAVCVLKNDYYQSAGFPLWMDWTARFAAPAACSPERASVGDFTFEIVEGVYLEDRDEYLLTLRASSLRFWEQLRGDAFYRGLTAIASDGTRYPMRRTDGELPSGTVHLARWDLFRREYGVYIPAEGWSGEDWVTLELESQLGGFTLSALVTESGVEP